MTSEKDGVSSAVPPKEVEVACELDKIFKNLKLRKSADDGQSQLEQIKTAASDLLARELGNRFDYELIYDVYRGSDDLFHLYVKGSELKEPRDQDAHSACNAISQLLDNYGVSSQSGAAVFRGLESTIAFCTIRYHFNRKTGEFGYLSPGHFGYILSDRITGSYTPMVAAAARSFLSSTAEHWYLAKVKAEIQPLHLVDRIAEVNRRMMAFDSDVWWAALLGHSLTADFFKKLLERIRDELEAQLRIEKKRLADMKALKRLESVPPAASSQQNERLESIDFLPPEAERLSRICKLFKEATSETQRIAWRLMQTFTRKQWAHFADKSKILANSTKTDRAEQIQEISGLSNLRDLFGSRVTATDKTAVNDVITLLNADLLKSQDA